MTRPPRATYRVQLSSEFRFEDLLRRLPYLRDLGISHVYLSPCLGARPGSSHGYDISNHRELNPDLGTHEDFLGLTATAKNLGLGIIFDIVPNHMGILGNRNDWWNDILENGMASPYALYFDIDWNASVKQELRNKVLLPILGRSYGDVLVSGELTLKLSEGRFIVSYFDQQLPISPCSIEPILRNRLSDLESAASDIGEDILEYQSIITAVRNLPKQTERDPEKIAERLREKEVIRKRIEGLLLRSEAIRASLEQTVQEYNGVVGEEGSFDKLDDLLNSQVYRLSYFRVAMDEINYRRFFDINELAALSMERQEVFDAAHSLILELVRAGHVNGLRIDHVDGLFDPKRYLEMLRSASSGADLYLIVEKILAPDEHLPENWPVDGTTGYELLNQVNLLFVDPQSEKALNRLYSKWSSGTPSFHEVSYRSRDEVQRTSLSSELHVLSQHLDAISEMNRHHRDFTLAALTAALRDVISSFPVYRSYVDENGVSDIDRKRFEYALKYARRRNPAVHSSIFDFILQTLLLKPDEGSPEYKERQKAFVRKFQQVTSPVAAKGIEDTAFYIFLRLVSLNEVGGSPERFGCEMKDFHSAMKLRREKIPNSLSTLSTHDTKRGEDTRARVNVLSETPEVFSHLLSRFERVNRRFATDLESGRVPNKNMIYFIFQTLVGSWPHDFSLETLPGYRERIVSYVQKAVHEAKQFTSWVNPDEKYDRAITNYLERVLDRRNFKYLSELNTALPRIIHFGFFNSLSQTCLKLTCPGVPDHYQGTELWDFSLVDPDNRRKVDFESRESLLKTLKQRYESEDQHVWSDTLTELLGSMQDGRIKLFLISRLLDLRQNYHSAFAHGEYLPIAGDGTSANHLLGFGRQWEGEKILVFVPRLNARLLSQKLEPQLPLPVGAEVWTDTHAILPETYHGAYENVFTKETLNLGNRAEAQELLRRFPLAVLRSV